MTPIEIVATSVQRERSRAGLSLSQLAKRAGVAKSTLFSLETGAGNPSIETLWSIAQALEVPVSRLMEAPRATVQLVRAGDGAPAASEKGNYLATLLSACPPNARRDVYRLVVRPGEPKISEPHPPGTVEHLVLTAGRALAGPADQPVELGPNDYLRYPADAPHIFEALEPETMAVLLIEMV